MIDTIADLVRIYNLVVALAVLALSVTQVRNWRGASRSVLMSRSAVGAFALAAIVGTWEQLADPTPPPGVRVWLFTIALTWALASFIFASHDRPKEHP